MKLSRRELAAIRSAQRASREAKLNWVVVPIFLASFFFEPLMLEVPFTMALLVFGVGTALRPMVSPDALTLLDRYVRADPEAIEALAASNREQRPA